MAAFGPFESRPHLALAVSGGADSMALALLARDWARRRRGQLTALTVDHGLRAESRTEARRVGRWLAAQGIAQRILVWKDGGSARGPGLQALARDARYRLMEDWCAHHGVLHLLLAHQMDDQAETFLLRLGQGSGLVGLSAMTGLRETATLRLLRPLLGIGRAALEGFLCDRGQDWVRDPSNRNTAFARVRLRALAPELAVEGFDTQAGAQLAVRFGKLRGAIDDAIARRLIGAVSPHPAGFVYLRPKALADGSAWEGARALGRVLAMVGGGGYPPRQVRLDRLYGEIAGGNFRGRTLAGCRVAPMGKNILVCREAAALAPPVAARAGDNRWDGRVVWHMPGAGLPRGARIGALGADGLAEVRAAAPEVLETGLGRAIPAQARVSLPALFGAGGVIAVPHLGYRRRKRGAARVSPGNCRILTAECLAGAGFFRRPGGL